MTGHEFKERQQTMADKLKARAATLTEKKVMEETCIILVDGSSSMNESTGQDGKTKLEAVKQAIPHLRALGSYVGYGLISFSGGAEVIQDVSTNFSSILLQSDLLYASGMTNIPDALRKGRQLLVESTAEKKRMILLSDGFNNCEGNQMEEQIKGCVDEKIIVDTIAFSASADVNLLRSIAVRTGGKFTLVTSPLELEGAYQKLNYQQRYLEDKNGREK